MQKKEEKTEKKMNDYDDVLGEKIDSKKTKKKEKRKDEIKDVKAAEAGDVVMSPRYSELPTVKKSSSVKAEMAMRRRADSYPGSRAFQPLPTPPPSSYTTRGRRQLVVSDNVNEYAEIMDVNTHTTKI